MKQKLIALIMAMAIFLAGDFSGGIEAQAEETGEDIDLSYLLTDDALIGYAETQTWGAYLGSGYSIINKISSTKIGAGGVTNAAVKCKVTVCAIVERKTSSGWSRVTSWTQTNENAYAAMISKSLSVGTGYYYRVRSLHYASTDTSSSGTGSLWMGN